MLTHSASEIVDWAASGPAVLLTGSKTEEGFGNVEISRR